MYARPYAAYWGCEDPICGFSQPDATLMRRRAEGQASHGRLLVLIGP